MTRDENPLPFGFHFRESAPSGAELPALQYDEETDISYVEVSGGQRVPFVDLKKASGTHTITEAPGEVTDQDISDQTFAAGTYTATKAVETTDQDREEFIMMATDTHLTEAQLDTTDRD
jgi:hypothetical protein